MKYTKEQKRLAKRVNANGQRRRKLRELSCIHGLKCWYCGIPVGASSGIAPHIDHVVPTSKGGVDDRDNRALACEFCNRAKGSRSLYEFLKWLEWIRASSETLIKEQS